MRSAAAGRYQELMPTSPVEGLLHRSQSKAEQRELIDVASPLLKELVDNGTHVLARCIGEASKNPDEDIAAYFLYRHIIEAADGVQILLSQAASAPAISVLRSLFEGYLQLLYLLQDDARYSERARAFVVVHIHDRLNFYDSIDPATKAGVKLFSALKSEHPELEAVFKKICPNPGQLAANLGKAFVRVHLQPIEVEYQRTRKKNPFPAWYSLFSGPRNLRELADKTSRASDYATLYGQFSRVAHASGLERSIVRSGTPGRSLIRPLRASDELRNVAVLATGFTLSATRQMLARFRSDELIQRQSYQKWYLREIRDPYRALAGPPRRVP